jgi:hypothetical protein
MANDFLTDLFLPNVQVPEPKLPIKLPDVAGDVQIVTLNHILSWVQKNSIKAYPNNRGRGRFSMRTSKSVYDKVKADVIGECTIGYMHGQLHLCDFHSRIAGLIKRLNDGKLTQDELNIKVSLRVSNHAVGSYQGLNGGDTHGSFEKTINPDYIFGDFIKKVEESVGTDCVKMMGERMTTVMSCILYNFFTNPDATNRRWDWSFVYRLRQIAGKQADYLAGNVVLSDKDLKCFIEGVRFWHLLMRDLNAACSSNINKIRNSTGFFGYIVCKHLQGYKFPKMNLIVERIIKNLPDFCVSCSHLCRGNSNEVADFVEKIERTLKMKQ